MSNRQMTAQAELPSWVTGITRKRPEVAELVYAMIRHGIMHGQVTAEDVHYVPVTHQNTRGAAAKYLRHAGFTAERLATGTTRKSHGHYMAVWKLTDHALARRILDSMAQRVTMITTEREQKGQMVLF